MTSEDSKSLAVSIRVLTDRPRVGDPVPIEFTIRNIEKRDYSYLDRSYDRAGRMPEYELIAQSASGAKVSDPRATYLITTMGGLAQKATLKPDQSFKKTIVLNRWALLTQPGQYTVTGIYHLENSNVAARSKPIQLSLAARTKGEMATYVAQLQDELPRANNEKFDDVVQKLMFTCDPVIVPSLIDAMYKHDSNFWISEALNFYLPKESVKPAILKACKDRGLAPGSTAVLYALKQPWTPGYDPLSRTEWKQIISRSLTSDNPICWSEGSLVAQTHPDDAYTERLIAIAESPQSKGRAQAIYALAFNRTGESVKALRQLLNDPENWVKETTKTAIKLAYRDRSITGKRLLETDFDASFRKPD